MGLYVLACVLLAMVCPVETNACKPSGSLKIVQSSIEFKVKNAEIQVGGDFKIVNATINFDPKSPAKSEFNAVVDVNSIHTGIRLRDKHLKGKFYFDAATFPQMTIKGTEVVFTGDATYKAKFKINIKGVEKEQELSFRVVEEQPGKFIFSSRFFLNRRDFNIGGKSWTMSNNIEVSVKFTGVQ